MIGNLYCKVMMDIIDSYLVMNVLAQANSNARLSASERYLEPPSCSFNWHCETAYEHVKHNWGFYKHISKQMLRRRNVGLESQTSIDSSNALMDHGCDSYLGTSLRLRSLT